ncbi:MAG: dienelactone hydrolase family protein [Clostridia bacterium]|nr:dienelactone hydrolase family protein [Clostridia bacterium]
MNTAFVFKSKIKPSLSLNYLVALPDNYKESDNLPMIVFLHGSGERGNDVEKVKTHGLAKTYEKHTPRGFIVLSPQCPENRCWDNYVEELMELIDSVANQYGVDKKRISITGLSMGGFGTWSMGINYPDYFSAMAPICGGGMEWRADCLKDIPIKVFHGVLDAVVPVKRSIDMVKAVNKAGGKATITLYGKVGHNSWDCAYTGSELVDWLIGNVKD